ncbi:hypothetical protein ACEPAF_2432 [Sanghuangporus sanghuang]
MASIFTGAIASLRNVLSWVPHSSDRGTPPHELQISPSDLLASLPNSARDFRINPLCKVVSEASDTWAAENIGLSPSRVKKAAIVKDARPDLDGDEENEMLDLKIGLLASMCFPKSDYNQLRICADFLTWIWLLNHCLASYNGKEGRSCVEENIRLTEDEPGCTEISDPGFAKGLQTILRRLERSPEAGYAYDRFRIAVRDYLQLLLEHLGGLSGSKLSQSAKDYITQQRQRGWHTSLFILIEYSYGLRSLSEEPQRHPIKALMRDARDSAAEVIVYASDIYACAGALSQNSLQNLPAHNVVKLLAGKQNSSILSAITRAKEICLGRLRSFSILQEQLLRESPEPQLSNSNVFTPTDVAICARALGDCIQGVIYWSFESERFWGQNGSQATLIVDPTGSGNDLQGEVIMG